MDYRRRLIALHQDERGYSVKGKRGSGLVSIDVNGDTASITVTARDLIRPQNGIYVAVLFASHAPNSPFVLGEIDYNERTMLLHKSLPLSFFPHDIDDYRAAAVVFVGPHIDFVLVGQSDYMPDWIKVKSFMRLKGPGCLKPMPQPRRPSGRRRQMGANEDGKVTATISEAVVEKKPTVSVKPYDVAKDVAMTKPDYEARGFDYSELEDKPTIAPRIPNNNNMPLREYGMLHFVDNNGDSYVEKQGAFTASAPYVPSGFETERTYKDADNDEIPEAEGFDYSELYASESEVSSAEETEGLAQVHYDKGIESAPVISIAPAYEEDEIETFSEIQEAQGFNYSELYDENEVPSQSTSGLTIEPADQDDEIETYSEIQQAKGFDYSELDAPSQSASGLSIETEDDTVETAGEIEDAEEFEYPEVYDDDDAIASVHYDKGIETVSTPILKKSYYYDDDAAATETDADEPAVAQLDIDDDAPTESELSLEDDEQESEAMSANINEEENSLQHTSSYMATMTDKEYESALNPYRENGEELEESKESFGENETITEDIDPCIYNKTEVRKKMNTCMRHGRRLPVRPFPAMTNSSWYKVEYPAMGSSFHYLIGSIHDRNGNLQARCTAVPGPYGINPPAGLNGYSHYMTAQGMGNAGYWVSFVDPKTGRPMDTV